MNITLVEAIVAKKRLLVTYNGTERLCEPHAYGLDKNGVAKLRVYQVAEAEEHQGWRLLKEDAITDLKVVEETFTGAQVGYKPNDTQIPNVYAQL